MFNIDILLSLLRDSLTIPKPIYTAPHCVVGVQLEFETLQYPRA